MRGSEGSRGVQSGIKPCLRVPWQGDRRVPLGRGVRAITVGQGVRIRLGGISTQDSIVRTSGVGGFEEEFLGGSHPVRVLWGC